MRYHNPDNLIYTRNGLKIRFSAEAMEPVIRPLKLAGRIELDWELYDQQMPARSRHTDTEH